MTEEQTPAAKQIFELYDLMESKLEELGINFDEFTVLYKAFRNPPAVNGNTNPFPWVKSAGEGWS